MCLLQFKWSRKGFMRTRWIIHNQCVLYTDLTLITSQGSTLFSFTFVFNWLAHVLEHCPDNRAKVLLSLILLGTIKIALSFIMSPQRRLIKNNIYVKFCQNPKTYLTLKTATQINNFILTMDGISNESWCCFIYAGCVSRFTLSTLLGGNVSVLHLQFVFADSERPKILLNAVQIVKVL